MKQLAEACVCALLAVACAVDSRSEHPAERTSAPTVALPKAPAAEAAPVAPQAAPISPSWTPPPALDAKPAVVPMPSAPPPQKPAREADAAARDAAVPIARDASVVGRLPEAGQRASFAFEAEAGEQSLFELAAAAYARGGGGRVRISIEDAKGKIVRQSERDVGTVWRDFTAFTPDRAGTWTYTVTAIESGYRFALVRHSSYPVLADAPLDLGTRELVHAHLPTAEAVATFRVPVTAGEELALKLLPTREEARDEARRGATDMGAMVTRMELQPANGRMAGGAKLLFQRFDLEVLADGVPLARAGTYARFRAPKDGAVDVRVRARYGACGGGLFDLVVERPLTLLHVRGVVVDADDEPVRDVEISFLREPDADLVGSTRTNGAGEYEATVLAGNLAVQMLRGQIAAAETVRVRVTSDTTVDLVFQPGAKLRIR
ncbi:MAG TPA: carboxypeptidase-like regulatory domain-containing protein [Planctomycetota bacterium]|nr:carboxypeptidase-like regulatory domain-containing protein [Planctomycetota bacterium]